MIYGTMIRGVDLERERLINVKNPRLVKRLCKIEVKRIMKLFRDENGRKNEM